MFATVYVIDMPGGEPEGALCGIGEPSEEWANEPFDDRVFYYFQSLDEIRREHTDWGPDTWFIVVGIDLPCYSCSEVGDLADNPNTLVHREVDGPDDFGGKPLMDTVPMCGDCREAHNY